MRVVGVVHHTLLERVGPVALVAAVQQTILLNLELRIQEEAVLVFMALLGKLLVQVVQA